MFRHSNNQRNLSFNSIFDRFPALGRRDKHGRGVGFELLFCFFHVGEEGEAEVFAFFSRCDAAYDVGAPGLGFFGVAGCDAAGEALVHYAGVFADFEIGDCVFVGAACCAGGEESGCTGERVGVRTRGEVVVEGVGAAFTAESRHCDVYAERKYLSVVTKERSQS